MSQHCLRLTILTWCFSIFCYVPGLQAESAPGEEPAVEVSPCKDKLTRVGRPNSFKVVASLNAVRAWSEAAKKIGAGYNSWHKAKGAAVTCEKKGRGGIFVCFASGKPCKNETVAEKKTDNTVKLDPLSESFGLENY